MAELVCFPCSWALPGEHLSDPGPVLLSGQLVNVTCQAPETCSGTPPQITWTGGFDYAARNVSVALANGSVSYSSVLSFTPAPGDEGKELVCTVTYPAVVGVCTRRGILPLRCTPQFITSPVGPIADLTADTSCWFAEGSSLTLIVALAVCGTLVATGGGSGGNCSLEGGNKWIPQDQLSLPGSVKFHLLPSILTHSPLPC
uniref:Ig-like domain-containing protein n=1 Tax=Chelydra serpentina TaxID=8475 RepID=A0A8C3SRL2_CHESE